MSKKSALRKYQRHEPLLKRLATLKSFTISEARELGLSHPTLLALVSRRTVIRLERGIYAVSGSEEIGKEGDFSVANKKFSGQCVIGGLTALSYYQLLDEIPSKIWLLVPPHIRTTDRKYRLLRTKRNLSIGVIKKSSFTITSLERTLVDSLVFSPKIGEKVSKLAILRAIRNGLTTQQKIFEMAKKLELLPLLDREWQSILAGLSK